MDKKALKKEKKRNPFSHSVQSEDVKAKEVLG